ncbi:TPA: hypothetical protein N0F65_006710 [Lagenidium giganteum]|uniref:E3 ubiquitin-protein ligase n=1 Tax=Lagenidium giganteum TaxID=4803 RepID=A0AAV2Z983_9STRA|nr:TPA: hypothetical protein N0F65_006710 [Lagenidium giganteum]
MRASAPATKAALPLHHPQLLRAFLAAQPLAECCSQWLPGLLPRLRDSLFQRGVPSDAVPLFLDAVLLSQTTAPNAETDADADVDAAAAAAATCEAFFEQFKPKTSAQGLCGYMFQRNDIAFNCKTCQKDETCVLCLKCYQNGNHEGHDITFHRTQPGGMCDCGDPEAWAPEGFCVNHGGSADTAGPDESELSLLPEHVTRVADALFQDIVAFMVDMAKRSNDIFDSERVDVLGRQLMADYQRQVVLLGDRTGVQEPRFHVRICNDDVHSDEDLVRSLTEKNIKDAKTLVRAIDANGSEVVAQHLVLRDALTLMQDLKGEGWHVCVITDAQVYAEGMLIHIIQWIKKLSSLSKPLHNMFCAKLFAADNPVSAPKEPIQVMFLSDPYFRKEIVLELYELYLRLQGDKDLKLKFSLVFLKVYSRLMSKYFCGIGTRDESLFQYGVQIFTTPSIVKNLAELGLLDMLLDTINLALEIAKTTRSEPEAFPCNGVLDCEHWLLKFKRYSYVMDNFGYVLNIPSMVSEVLLRKELLTKCFSALRQMQGLDPQVRVQDGHAHVSYETHQWLSAFNFHSYGSRLLMVLAKGIRHHEGAAEEKTRMIRNVMECFWDQMLASGMTDGALRLHTPPFGSVVGADQHEQIVKYDVATQPASFHYPLHGLLANFLQESLYFGPENPYGTLIPWVTDWRQFIMSTLPETEDGDDHNSRLLLVYGMIEYPLRTMVLCSQVHSGLWIRNGQSMNRQMVHYTIPPFCGELRDFDLLLVQIGACVIGFRSFLTVYFDRFGLLEWLSSFPSSGRVKSRDEKFYFANVEDKLVLLLESALLQLIWIASEAPPPVEAIQQDDVFLRRQIVHRLAQSSCRLSELLDQTLYVMVMAYGSVSTSRGKDHLARIEAILSEVADIQAKKSVDDVAGADGMEPNRYELKKEFFREYDPAYFHLSRSSHEKAQFGRQEALFRHWKVEDPPIPMVAVLPPAHVTFAPLRQLVLEKGLLGILRLILEDATGNYPGSKRTNVMVIMRTIHLINLAVLILQNAHVTPSFATGNASNVVVTESTKKEVLTLLRSGPDAFGEGEPSRGKKRVKRQVDHADGESDVHMSSDSDQGEVNEVKDYSIVALLVALVKDQVKNDFDTLKSSISAIYWILRELGAMDLAVKQFVQQELWSGMKQHHEHVNQEGLSKAQLKKLHQERAIAAMMARQKAFAQSSCFADMADEEEDDEDMIVGGDEGTDGQILPTTVVFRPPPPPDCIICSQKKKDDPVMYIGHTQMSKVISHAHEEKPSATGNSSFPPPMFVTLCGHAVHLYCWKKYFDAVRAQSRFNLEHNQSNIAFDAHFGEFLCPLCQTLSSMLVPYSPACRTLTYEDRQRNGDAMERVFQLKQDTSSILSWLSEDLPSRLSKLNVDDNEDETDGEFGAMDGDDDQEGRQKDDVRAMRQFAVSFLEAMLRFQPEMTHITTALAALTKGFLSTGPQLAHLIWSAVSTTCTSAQLSGLSSAVYRLNMSAGAAQQATKAQLSRGVSNSTTATATAGSFSSLRITSILNPSFPPLKDRLAVLLPESLENHMDPFSPKEDSKLNCLLRALRRVHLLFKGRKRDLYSSIGRPIEQNLRLKFSLTEWIEALPSGPPLQLGQPLLGLDLFYVCIAVCTSMLRSKADILMTIRSFCVLHMAQTLIHIATLESEGDEDDTSTAASEAEASMQQALTELMIRLGGHAGVNVWLRGSKPESSHSKPSGTELMYLFQSTCLVFMRQVTLLCRAFFRGENDPDASFYANFVSSLRLSTNYHDMCQQLGVPTVEQVLADDKLMLYLDQAAVQLQEARFAAVPDDVQQTYQKTGFVEDMVAVATDLHAMEVPDLPMRVELINRTLKKMPPLPIRVVEEHNSYRKYFAAARLARLSPLYTDLHAEVLAKSRCKQTRKPIDSPAICLICDEVLCAGTDCCRRPSDGVGSCTLHAIACGHGVGMFFLMRSSSVLLVFGPRSSYFGSPYLDMFGEEDINLRRGRPLFLNSKRMKALLTLYANHQLANEVARNRRTSDQYIRNNYY